MMMMMMRRTPPHHPQDHHLGPDHGICNRPFDRPVDRLVDRLVDRPLVFAYPSDRCFELPFECFVVPCYCESFLLHYGAIACTDVPVPTRQTPTATTATDFFLLLNPPHLETYDREIFI